MSPALRWFWRIYIPVALLALLGMPTLALGPVVESRLDPPRTSNENLHPTRTPDRVCWVWSSDKLRMAFSDDVDVHLDVLDRAGAVQRTFVPALYNALTGLPWQSGLSLSIGHHEIPYCIDLPRTVRAESRIRIRFTPIVHGWLGLWPLPIWTPDIAAPPAPVPRLSRHRAPASGTAPRRPERVGGAFCVCGRVQRFRAGARPRSLQRLLAPTRLRLCLGEGELPLRHAARRIGLHGLGQRLRRGLRRDGLLRLGLVLWGPLRELDRHRRACWYARLRRT